MPTHTSFFILHNLCCGDKNGISYGPWEHIPSSVWAEEEAPEVDKDDDDTYLCQVCGKRDTSECSTCDLYLCSGCMREHTCEIEVLE